MSFEPTRSTPAEPFTPASPEPFPPAATASVNAPPPTITATKRKGGGGRWLNIVLVIAAAVAIGGVAFAVGRSTVPASAAAGRGAFGNGPGFPTGSFEPGASGQPGFARGAFGGGGLTVRGTVESVSGDTMTIKTATGQTIEVKTGSATTYNTQSPANATDVKTGSSVEVQLEFGGGNRPNASAAPGTPVGTAVSVTVIP